MAESIATTTADIQWEQRIDLQLVVRVPYGFAKKHNVLAVRNDGQRIHVLCPVYPAVAIITELRRLLGRSLEFHQLEQSRFEKLMRQSYDKGQSEATQMIDDLGDEVDLAMLAHDLPQTTDLLEASNEAPIVRLINALLTQEIGRAHV